MHHGKGDAVFQLSGNSGVYTGIAYPSERRPDAHIVVDILIAVCHPYVCVLSSFQVFGRYAFDVLTGAFGQCLSNRCHDLYGAGIEFI